MIASAAFFIFKEFVVFFLMKFFWHTTGSEKEKREDLPWTHF